MLTKDHLKYRVRTGRIYPGFLDEADPEVLTLGAEMIGVFKEAAGSRFGELEETIDALGRQAYLPAFKKLLLDQCGEEEDDGALEVQRWEWLTAATELRRDVGAATPEEFRARMAAVAGRPFDLMKEQVYGDLPACRRMSEFKEITPETLVQKYNLAQVQGLVLRARSLVVKIKSANLGERRGLFRQLKFHRLLGEVSVSSKPEDGLSLTLGGPLSLFDQAATYGIRLANFIPYVLRLKQWEIEAEVNVKNKNLRLVLDQTCGVTSHYKSLDGYVPEELTTFLTDFGDKGDGWKVELGGDFVHIGRQSYCFPDFTLVHESGKKVSVELFHRWHAGQLLGRLDALGKGDGPSLYIGVARALARDAKVAKALEASSWFAKNGFVFSEFPTPKGLRAVLARA